MRQSMLLEGPLSEYEQRIARLTEEVTHIIGGRKQNALLLRSSQYCVGFQCFHAWYVGAFR